MWIFTKDYAVNTDNVMTMSLDDEYIIFSNPKLSNSTSIHCGSSSGAAYVFKDIISELGKGTLIFNVDRRLNK